MLCDSPFGERHLVTFIPLTHLEPSQINERRAHKKRGYFDGYDCTLTLRRDHTHGHYHLLRVSLLMHPSRPRYFYPLSTTTKTSAHFTFDEFLRRSKRSVNLVISAKENHPSRCQTKARKKHLKCAGWHYPETMIEGRERDQCLVDYRKLCCVCRRAAERSGEQVS